MGVRGNQNIRLVRKSVGNISTAASAAQKNIPVANNVYAFEPVNLSLIPMTPVTETYNHRRELGRLITSPKDKKYVSKGYSSTCKCDIHRYRRSLNVDGNDYELKVECYGKPDDNSSRWFVTLKSYNGKYFRTITTGFMTNSVHGKRPGDLDKLLYRQPSTKDGINRTGQILEALFRKVI